ncbi:MCP methyltransferase, CheR-type [Catenovulum agarivorans DS-2]|uniref:Chemotaxis protein methyltransferase n=1 Tax=Catenovulum agarivorans DS-2 TaxID=1328313 RepID=W7QQ72_9ALTE|nr:protein-glutamate O-methyltransferase CheR [Catenovulum agarivorans]EWH10053.1 MCP methyltransferase, CheR-type [Catenovulum agarivorans DS-2]
MHQHEFDMTSADFDYIKQQLYLHAGIVLGEHKKEMVYSRLSRRIRQLKLANFKQYCDYLETHNKQELSAFVNALTTNLTSFFREHHHFEFLKKMAQTKWQYDKSMNRKIRIWSAGCSTGEEPYSIAMTLADSINLRHWDCKILATDLDSNVLNVAKKAQYERSKLESSQLPLGLKYFDSDTQSTNLTVKPSVRELVHIKRLNLLQSEWPMKGLFDVIFCRNVVIYFDLDTKNQLIRRYAQYLKPNGYLFMGHSETMSREISEFKGLGQTIYQKQG